MKKICFFAHNNSLTGANKSMLDLIENLKKNDADYLFTVIVPKGGIIEEELKKRNINYKVITSFNLSYHMNGNLYFEKMKVLIKRMLNLVSHFRIKKFFLRNHFDIVHLNSLLTFEGAKIANELSIPYVWHIREFLQDDHCLSLYNLKEMIWLLKRCENCIGISEAITIKYIKKYNLKNVIRVYNGLSIEKCKFERFQINEKKVDISIIGRISASKGQLTVLYAYIRLLELSIENLGKLYIIGSPGSDNFNKIYDKQLRKIVKEKKIEDKVIFVPHTDDVLEYRKKTDITIVSSVCEAFGRVTIEGMLAQQVVIASDSGANTELISNNNNGLLFQLNNEHDLADKIELSIINIAKRELLQKNGYQYAIDNFSIERTANNVNKIYRNILMD